VAAFGQRLRAEKALSDFSYADIAALAHGARGEDADGYRAEFVRLVRQVDTLGQVGQR
jgi:Ca-activated chloride channel family protein